MITKTKLDDTFPLGQFYAEGFTTPYRLDRNHNGGGVIIYVRDDIPSKILEKHKLPQDIEAMFIELNFRKVKWLLFGTYHPPSLNDQYYFEPLDKALDCYISYGRIVLIRDYILKTTEPKWVILLKKVLVLKILQNLPLLIYF